MPIISSTQIFPELSTRNVTKKLAYRKCYPSQQPIENSQTGIVQETQDSITSQHDINQNSEIYDSQDFDFIQPGQQIRPTQPRLTQYSPLQLPSLSPIQQTSSNDTSCTEDRQNHYERHNNYHKNRPSNYHQDKNY